MDRHGLFGPIPRSPACLPKLALPVLRAPSRCPLRADGDALLTAGPVPSPPHLSLAAVHRRGWGSLYAALSMGRTDEAGLQDLLSRHPLGGAEPGCCPPIYAVDVSVWPRCDAPQTSPQRGYY